MKLFADYSTPVRDEALKRLRERDGLYVWAQTFDPNSDQVLLECQAVNAERLISFNQALDRMYDTITQEVVGQMT